MIKFGTGGFRGVIGEEFTKDNVQLVTQALCNIALRENRRLPVIVGYDYRFSSDFASKWVAEVISGNHMECWVYNEVMPTPAVMSVVKNKELDYGIMITASHNPYYYNGMKVFLQGGVDADVEFTSELERECRRVSKILAMDFDEAVKTGAAKKVCFKEQYLSDIKSFVSDKIKNNHAKILYNNLCGVGFVGLKPLAAEYRIKQFDIINEKHDAFFNEELPNPTREMLLPMQETVVSNGYDFAMATDSDGDRLGVLDENGDYVDNNDILACIYYYLVQYRGMKGDVVKNCATSILMDKLAARLGFQCHEVDVGFKNISSKMREVDALIGGESSGGLTVRGYVMGKDSVFSASLFMEMQIVMDKSVSAIVKEVHEFAGYEYKIMEDSVLFQETESIRRTLNEHDPVLDGTVLKVNKCNQNYKYYFSDDRWVLIRMSGTEPAIRIFAEMESATKSDSQIRRIKEFLSA